METIVKEKKAFELVGKILGTHGDIVDKLHIVENEDDEDIEYRIFHGDGYCFDLRRNKECDESEVEEVGGVDENGYSYYFCDVWDGFKRISIDKVIELLNEYAK